jgi:hypothetical protein
MISERDFRESFPSWSFVHERLKGEECWRGVLGSGKDSCVCLLPKSVNREGWRESERSVVTRERC